MPSRASLHLYEPVDEDRYTQAKLAELFSVSRTVIYREIRRRAANPERLLPGARAQD